MFLGIVMWIRNVMGKSNMFLFNKKMTDTSQYVVKELIEIMFQLK